MEIYATMFGWIMIEIIVFIIFISSFLLLIIDNARLRIKNLKVKKKVISLATEIIIVSQRLEKELQLKKDGLPENSEGFVKFVSQSRDWAFQYIEEVQSGIHTFIKNTEPEINYFDEYGIASSAYPHYHSMKKISGAYKELKKLLPEDYDRIE
jgi:hypothetical protein